MRESARYRGTARLLVVVLMLTMTGCVAYLPSGVGVYGGVGIGYYSPLFYNGYVVYFDGVGLPYYYRGGRIVYVPRSYGGYRGLTRHYQRYRKEYHRWYRDRGYRYHGYHRPPSPPPTRRRGYFSDRDTRYGRVRGHPPQTGRSVEPRKSIPGGRRADPRSPAEAPRHRGRYSQPESRRGPSDRRGRQTGRSAQPRTSFPGDRRADPGSPAEAPRHRGRYSQPESRRGPSNRKGRPERRGTG